SRTMRASAGLRPAVETETINAPRRSTDGRMKSQCAGSSAAFTQIRCRRASAATPALTVRSSLAAKTILARRRSARRYARSRTVVNFSSANLPSLVVTDGLATVTGAPVGSRPSTLRSATVPPPTTRTGRPSRSRTTGYGPMTSDRVHERAHRALFRLDVRCDAVFSKRGGADRADGGDDDAVTQRS